MATTDVTSPSDMRGTHSLTRLKLYSLNVRGLNSPEKLSRLLYSLWKEKPHIVLIQETHFRSDSVPKLHDRNFPTVFHAPNETAKSKGVSILISRHCPFPFSDVQRDPQGRYIFIKGTLHDLSFMIANVYAPNSQQVPFFRRVLYHLTAFQSGTLAVAMFP